MTARYRHAPEAYRITAADLADGLDALAGHLARIGTPDATLAARLDDLTDAVVAAEAELVAILVDLDDAAEVTR